MKEASSEPPNIDGSRSGAQPAAPTAQGLNEQPRNEEVNEKTHSNKQNGSRKNSLLKIPSAGDVPSHTSSQAARSGSVIETPPGKAEEPAQEDISSTTSRKAGFLAEVKRSIRISVTYSWLNVFLVFVPVGIAVAQINGVHAGLVFGMNAIAIIPLAGLLAFATESVARKMGDALGALLNVTFGKSIHSYSLRASTNMILGNAVELIIFILALVKNEIREIGRAHV